MSESKVVEKTVTLDQQDISDRKLDNGLKIVDKFTGTVLGKDKRGNTRSAVDAFKKIHKELRKGKEQDHRHAMEDRQIESQGKKKKKKKH